MADHDTDHDPIDDLLAGLRTDVPGMSDDAFEAGRSRLRATVSLEPVVTALTPDTAVVPLPKRRLLRSPPRRLATVAAAAAAVVALAATALVMQAARSDAPALSAAAMGLNTAADNINPVDEPIGPDQYRYIVSHGWYTGTDKTGQLYPDMPLMIMSETLNEHWVPADTARQKCVDRVSSTGNVKYLAGDAAMAEREGYPMPYRGTDHFVAEACDKGSDRTWGTPDLELLASLPRDPGQLNDRLRNDKRSKVYVDADYTLVGAVDLILGSGVAPADLRAALYRTLAMTPGIEITEQVANLDGNKGTAFGITRKGQRQEVIIDPTTGQYIGSRFSYVYNQQQTDTSGSDAPVSSSTVPPSTLTKDPSTLTKEVLVSYSTMSNPVVVDKVGDTR